MWNILAIVGRWLAPACLVRWLSSRAAVRLLPWLLKAGYRLLYLGLILRIVRAATSLVRGRPQPPVVLKVEPAESKPGEDIPVAEEAKEGD